MIELIPIVKGHPKGDVEDIVFYQRCACMAYWRARERPYGPYEFPPDDAYVIEAQKQAASDSAIAREMYEFYYPTQGS